MLLWLKDRFQPLVAPILGVNHFVLCCQTYSASAPSNAARARSLVSTHSHGLSCEGDTQRSHMLVQVSAGAALPRLCLSLQQGAKKLMPSI